MINSFSHGRRQQSAGFVNVFVAVQVMSAAPRTSDHHVFGSVSLTSLVCTGTSALHFVGGSVAAAAEIALETGEKDMSNFAADHDGYATRIVVNIGAPFSMVFRM
ncbi:hypothetical protein L3X38_013114 [Prunus dulcis]|uniref:Uncharacterized protein n=1 Tax=Prunus dulcis TaxID=3755 RepID=A0AAD4WMU7_PRUDU|nr:hypothetical protein L3X38_013114 [Prunus dulcis]